MIHSAKFGSIERFIGVLVEHYAGAFPPWLAPVQVQGIPIAERHNDYLADVAARMRAAGLRVEVDDSDDRMQKKIRNAQLQKVPFMVIAGDDDVEAGAVSLPLPRRRPGQRRAGRRGDRARGRGRRAAGAGVTAIPAASTGIGLRGASTGSGPRTGWRTSHRGDPVDDAEGCPFCAMRDLPDRRAWSSRGASTVFAVLNLHPYNPGHLMVLPYRHVAELEDLTAEEAAELMAMTQHGDPGAQAGQRPARLQHRAEPRRRRRRLAGRPPAPARRTPLVGRRELHHRRRRHQDPAPAAQQTRASCSPTPGSDVQALELHQVAGARRSGPGSQDRRVDDVPVADLDRAAGSSRPRPRRPVRPARSAGTAATPRCSPRSPSSRGTTGCGRRA